jgi:hypothetical protein
LKRDGQRSPEIIGYLALFRKKQFSRVLSDHTTYDNKARGPKATMPACEKPQPAFGGYSLGGPPQPSR